MKKPSKLKCITESLPMRGYSKWLETEHLVLFHQYGEDENSYHGFGDGENNIMVEQHWGTITNELILICTQYDQY